MKALNGKGKKTKKKVATKMKKQELTEGTKYDAGKPRFELIPTYPIRMLAAVYTMGAKKYADENWRQGIAWGRIYGALQRHLTAFWEGENLDPESGLPHLAHAMWGCVTLLWYSKYRTSFDNRGDLMAEVKIPSAVEEFMKDKAKNLG